VETVAHAGKADSARAKEIRLFTRAMKRLLPNIKVLERHSGGRIWSEAHFATFLSARFFYFERLSPSPETASREDPARSGSGVEMQNAGHRLSALSVPPASFRAARTKTAWENRKLFGRNGF